MEKQKKPIYKRVWFWILIVVVVIGMAANAGGNNNTEQTGSNVEQSNSNNEEERTITAVGQTVTTKYFKITVDSLQKPKGSTYSKAEEGKEFVQVNLTVENISDEEYSISSLMMFDAYCDSYSINESFKAQMADSSLSTMNGALASGKKLRGKLAYELPSDWKELEIDIDLTVLKWSNDGKIKIKLQNQ